MRPFNCPMCGYRNYADSKDMERLRAEADAAMLRIARRMEQAQQRSQYHPARIWRRLREALGL